MSSSEPELSDLKALIAYATRYHPRPVQRFRYHDLIVECLQYIETLIRSTSSVSMFCGTLKQYLEQDILMCRLKTASHRLCFLRECLRKKGVVPKPKQGLNEYLADVLELVAGEYRWNVFCNQQGREHFSQFVRYNPNRGYLKKKMKVLKEKTQESSTSDSSTSGNKLEIQSEDCLSSAKTLFSGTKQIFLPLKSRQPAHPAPSPRLCRQCHFACPVPTRSFCSTACLHLYKIRSSGSYVRKCLLARDAGVCEQCGLDAERLRTAVNRLFRKLNNQRENIVQRRERLSAALGVLLPHGIQCNRFNKRGVISRGQFWHADHILAVSQGGGEASLDGYRTLCVKCHQQMTALLQKTSRFSARRVKQDNTTSPPALTLSQEPLEDYRLHHKSSTKVIETFSITPEIKDAYSVSSFMERVRSRRLAIDNTVKMRDAVALRAEVEKQLFENSDATEFIVRPQT